MKVCLAVTLCGNGFDGVGGGGGWGGNCSLLNLESCASLWQNSGYAPAFRLTFFLTGNLTLSLVSTRLSLETLEQNKLNSTAKLSFSKLRKFRLKPHGFTELKCTKWACLNWKMDFGSRASIKLTFTPFNDEHNSATNCYEVAAICSCKFTSLGLTVGYCQFRSQNYKKE